MINETYPKTIDEFTLEWDGIPWLTEDKIDAPISLRWSISTTNYYVVYQTHSSTSDLTVTCWFQPKYIKIDAFYTTTRLEQSKTVTTYDWTNITTEWEYAGSLWYEIPSNQAVYLNYTSNECYMDVTDVSSTWFTLWNITLNWYWVWLHITIIW